MKSSSFLIGLLSASSLVLAFALLNSPQSERSARADNISDADYRLVTCTTQNGGGDDVLVVYMVRDGYMLSYQIKAGTPARLEVIGKSDLNRDFSR